MYKYIVFKKHYFFLWLPYSKKFSEIIAVLVLSKKKIVNPEKTLLMDMEILQNQRKPFGEIQKREEDSGESFLKSFAVPFRFAA